MLHKNYNSNKKFLVNKHNNIRARKIDNKNCTEYKKSMNY